ANLRSALRLAAARMRHGNHPGAHVDRGLRDAVDEVVARIDAHDVARADADPYEVRGVHERGVVRVAAAETRQTVAGRVVDLEHPPADQAVGEAIVGRAFGAD